MANKLLTITSAAVLLSASAFASAGENGGGCGIGKVLMEGKEGKDAQTTVAIINLVADSVVPQTLFGMSSGTLGCDVSQQVNNTHQRETFVASNEDNLSIEMAQGQGEHLVSLATVMGIAKEDHATFFNTLQDNYGNISTSEDMLAGIDATLLQDSRLGKYVR